MKPKTTLKKLLAHKSKRWGGAEVTLAVFVVAIVSMMIVPLPTWLLDVLIATNLAIAVTILLVVLFVSDALAVATFPTILLLTTLFRLALNVSSTRLILLQANAGHVIKAFGLFVVRGNYIVGGIVFLILTIIQFLVIAKGSERVAEVGARFVLDAMPGKQMAIDAELRAGTIDGNEARRRRRTLSRESQFFGAMDGAMKFVKGDVIASVIIAVINILGGLGIGVAQHHMAAVDALKKYGLLTIGDGLVSQIPALVLSTAAGILVTRTASEEPDTPLGEEMAGQLLGVPKALQVSAAFLFLLALVPGLPAAPFLALAIALLVAAHLRGAVLDKRGAVDGPASATPHRAAAGRDGGESPFVPRVVQWSLDISEDLVALLDDTPDRPGLRTRIVSLRELLFAELGVPLQLPRIRIDAELPAAHAVVCTFEVPARAITVPTGDAGAAIDHLTIQTFAELHKRASDFLGFGETQRLVDQLEQFAPAVVRNAVPKPVTLPMLTDILRRLVDEGFSIRDLRLVLETLATTAINCKDPLTLAENVRAQFARVTTHRLTGGAGHLNVTVLDGRIEETIDRSIKRLPEGQFLELEPTLFRSIQLAVRRAISEQPTTDAVGERAVILVQRPAIRRHVWRMIETEIPRVVVVSPQDVRPDVQLRAVSRANLEGLAA